MKLPRIVWHALVSLVLAFILVGYAFLLMTLAGCAARRQNAAPAPRRPFYVIAFDRPRIDCVEIEHKPGTALRLWACATDPKVPHVR